MKRLLLPAAASLALGLLATHAAASYSGYIYRTVCPNGSLQVVWNQLVNGEEGGWTNNGLCGAQVMGVGYSGEQMFATVNIPYESTTSNNQATLWLYAYGMNSSGGGYEGNGQLCADIYAYDEFGNFYLNSGAQCTQTTSPQWQWISVQVDVPSLGTVVTQVGGQAFTKLNQTILGYESNGT
jgi:hypothetical protein